MSKRANISPLQLSFTAKELEEQALVKKDGAIFTESPLGLLERKMMNVLLLNAQSSLEDNHIFTINTGDLAYLTGSETNNYAYFRKILSTLRDTAIKWNITGEDWGGEHSLIAGFTYKKGKIEYSFDPLLQKYFLKDYLSYTKLMLSVQKEFAHSYSIPLYEICQKYFDPKRMQGETRFFPVDDLRKIFGVSKGKYDEFKIFNRDVLKPACKEINQVSDLMIHDVLFERSNRKISAVKFRISANERNWLKHNPYYRRDSEEESENSKLDDLILQSMIIKKIPVNQAKEFLKKYPAKDLQKALTAMENHHERIQYPSKFFESCLKEKRWQSSAYIPKNQGKKPDHILQKDETFSGSRSSDKEAMEKARRAYDKQMEKYRI